MPSLEKIKLPRLPLLFLCTFVLTLISCNLYEAGENKRSDKAKMEDAAIYIDSGKYDEALAILNKIYNKNPDTTNARLLQLLSNASSGSIGIDTFNVLEIIDDLDSSRTSGSIDLAGRLLGDRDGTLSRDGIRTKLETVGNSSIYYLEAITTKTLDHQAQLGLLSLIDTVLIIGDIILTAKSIDEIKLTEDGLYELYPDGYEDIPPANFYSHETRMNDNVQRIRTSIDAIEELSGSSNNQLTETFEEFLEEITDWQTGAITVNTLNRYMAGIIED